MPAVQLAAIGRCLPIKTFGPVRWFNPRGSLECWAPGLLEVGHRAFARRQGAWSLLALGGARLHVIDLDVGLANRIAHDFLALLGLLGEFDLSDDAGLLDHLGVFL